MSLKKICLVGPTGDLGIPLLEALVSAGTFDVSVLRRSNSNSSIPASLASKVTEISIAPEQTLEELTKAFTGQDAVIISVRPRDVPLHLRYADAALAAKVKRYVPADFGSSDAASPRSQSLLQLYRIKQSIQDHVAALAKENPDFSWSSIVCGHFFDYGIHAGLTHFFIDTHTVHLLEGGDIPASTSTLPRVAEATVRLLQRPDATRNRKLFVQSFCPTQLQILAELEKQTGKTWKREVITAEELLAVEKPKAEAGDREAIEEVVFVIGGLEADWRQKEEFAMDLLGLKDEDLAEQVAAVLKQHESHKSTE